MHALSSGSWSLDNQAVDALDYLEESHPEAFATIKAQFPEIEHRIWELHGSNLDTEAMGVDAEFSSWLVDAIEATDLVFWSDGEPFTVPTADELASDPEVYEWYYGEAPEDGDGGKVLNPHIPGGLLDELKQAEAQLGGSDV